MGWATKSLHILLENPPLNVQCCSQLEKPPFRNLGNEWHGKSARLDYVGNPGCHIQLPWQEMVVFRARTNGDDFGKVYDYHILSKSYETWRKFGSIVHVMGRSSMHKCIGIYIYIYIHCKGSHFGMDDHIPYTMFSPWHRWRMGKDILIKYPWKMWMSGWLCWFMAFELVFN